MQAHKLTQSRTHARVVPYFSKDDASRTRRAREAGQNTVRAQGRARARGAYSQTGKQWRVRAPVAFEQCIVNKRVDTKED